MTSLRCLLLCGGAGTRWGSRGAGSRKHLVEVEGEVLLARTFRQLGGHAADAHVVVNQGDAALYAPHVSGGARVQTIRDGGPEGTAADKFLSSRDLWSRDGVTVVLLGDVWFSDEAMAAILAPRSEDWLAFGRTGPSTFTGCPHGELFAQRFSRTDEHERCLLALEAMYRDLSCARAASGWAHYQLMIGASPNVHTVGPRFVEVDDFTDDFDAPADLEAWLRGRRAHGLAAAGRAGGGTPGRNEPCPCGSGVKFKRCCGA